MAELSREDLIDIISDALGESMDVDWTCGIGARYVLDALVKEGVVLFDGDAERRTAWLIEWPADKHNPTRYWHASEPAVMDPHDATWLVRRADAEAVIKRERLFAGARPVEHVFGLSLAKTAQALVAKSEAA